MDDDAQSDYPEGATPKPSAAKKQKKAKRQASGGQGAPGAIYVPEPTPAWQKVVLGILILAVVVAALWSVKVWVFDNQVQAQALEYELGIAERVNNMSNLIREMEIYMAPETLDKARTCAQQARIEYEAGKALIQEYRAWADPEHPSQTSITQYEQDFERQWTELIELAQQLDRTAMQETEGITDDNATPSNSGD